MLLKVISKKLESDNAFSLIFQKPKNFHFYAGQYLDVELPVDDKNGNTRAFTISSSPTEEILMISPKKGISVFKKRLERLKSGDLITTSHPAGTFTLDESTPAVFICGGIGITPFRSILKYVVDKKITTPITLIYSNTDKNFLFRKELDEWKKQLPNLTIHYIVTTQSRRLDQERLLKLYPIPLDNPIIARLQSFTLYPIYYLAGPPKLVDDFEEQLLDLGVEKTNIRYDRFDGY